MAGISNLQPGSGTVLFMKHYIKRSDSVRKCPLLKVFKNIFDLEKSVSGRLSGFYCTVNSISTVYIILEYRTIFDTFHN